MNEDIARIRDQLARVENPVALLEAIFAYLPVGLQIYAPDGRSLLTNRAHRDLFGAEPPPGYSILEDDIGERTGQIEAIRRAFKGEVVHIPLTWYDPRELTKVKVETGRRVAIETTFVPLFDRAGKLAYVAAVFKDLTDLETERRHLQDVLERLPEGVVIAGSDGTIALANEAARRIRPDLQPGARIADAVRTRRITRPDGTVIPVSPTTRALDGEMVLGEEIILELPGQRTPLLVNAAPLRDAEGRTVGAVAVFQDISRIREYEARLEAASRQKDEFLAVASHELRTPLTTLKLNVDMAALQARAPQPSFEALRDLVVETQRQTGRMARLIHSLIDMVRIDAGTLALAREPHDLREVVERGVVALRPIVLSPIVLELPEAPVRAAVDPERIEHVLVNLVNNATRYSPLRSEVRVRVAQRGREATFTVSDKGQGIAPEELARIFERFYRGKGVTTGLGLGLYISQEIAQRHGGTIEVQSEPARGSSFTVVLPASG